MSSSVVGNRDTSALSGSVPSGWTWPVRAAAVAYAACALIVFVSIVVQFVTAGTGIFTQAGLSWDARWQAHVTYGPAGILFGSILLIALSFGTRQPWRWTGAAALMLVLYIVQSLLIQLYDNDNPVLKSVAALHVVNAGVMLWLGLALAGRGVDTGRSALKVHDVGMAS